MTDSLRPLIEPNGRISHIRLSESGSIRAFGTRTKVRVDDAGIVAAYLLAEPSATLAPDTRTSIPPLLHTHYGSFIATTQDSDFSGDAARLAGPASLRGRLGLWPIAGVLPAYLG